MRNVAFDHKQQKDGYPRPMQRHRFAASEVPEDEADAFAADFVEDFRTIEQL